MARFAFVAIDREGRERSGALTAANEAVARAEITKRQWLVIRIAQDSDRPTQNPARGEAAPARGARLSNRDQVLFARQLATLIEAAVPVDEALGLIADQQEKPHARRIIADVQEGVVEGQRLADSMARHPKSFPALLRAAISGGERAGALAPVLGRLADYLARAEALRSKITTAMVYPTALIAVAVMVIAALMIFVVPSLTQQFQSFRSELPLITQVLIAVSRFLSDYWLIVFGLIAVGVFVARAMLARPTVALARDRALLGAPLFGKWLRAVNASRFARALSTLTASGLPVLDGVRAARASVPNRHIAATLDAMATRIEEGLPLSQAMRASGVFPPLVSYMAASGESSGNLALMLEKASDHLDQEFEAVSTRAMSLFEPAVILLMGAVVALIVLSIMLPILQLNQLAIR